jgi:hypothetical protein
MLVHISLEVKRALIWWRQPRNNLKDIPVGTPHPDLTLFSDASKEGWGAHIEDSQALGIWDLTLARNNINWLELEAVSRALQAFLPLIRGKKVAIMTDNTTVVGQIRNQGGTRSATLSALTSRILQWADNQHITLIPCYLPGKLNVIADQLSRSSQIIQTEWSLHPEITSAIWNLWTKPHVDLFVSHLNKLETFVSPLPVPGAWKVDALSISWDGLQAYAYPPVPLLPLVIQKIRNSECEMFLIAPKWNTQMWYTDLLRIIVAQPRALPLWPKLLRQPISGIFHSNLENSSFTFGDA